MTSTDIEFFRRCFSLGLVESPFLEIGSARVTGEALPNLCLLAHELGVDRTLGVDLKPGLGVDATANFALATDLFQQSWSHNGFSTVAIFNVLEHTFDPITVLRNALSCVVEGGTLLVSTPVVWPIHNYPRDYNRLLPDWYEEFARYNNITICDDAFCWLSGQFGISRVSEMKEDGTFVLPTFLTVGKVRSPIRYWTSRAIHKLLHTYGRSHSMTHAALGVGFCR